MRRYNYLDGNPKLNTTNINELNELEAAAIDLLYWIDRIKNKRLDKSA